MPSGALTALCSAFLFTLGLLPVTYWIAPGRGRDGNPAGIGIILLCLLRAIAMSVAFYLLRREGGWLRWALMGGTLALEIAIATLLFLSIDRTIRVPFPLLFGILAVAVPLSAIGAAWKGSAVAYTWVAGIGVATALSATTAYRPLTADWHAARTAAAHPELAARLAQLQSIPANAKPDELLPFTGPGERQEVRIPALARLEKFTPEILAMLEGPRRLDALYVLQDWFHQLPDADRERCWTAAGEEARSMLAKVQSGQAIPAKDLDRLMQPAELFHRRQDAVAARQGKDWEALERLRAALAQHDSAR